MNSTTSLKKALLALVCTSAVVGTNAWSQEADLAAGKLKGDAVISLLKSGNMAPIEALYTDQMKQATANKSMASAWQDIKRQLGELQTCDAATAEFKTAKIEGADTNLAVVTHPCKFEKAPFNIITTWDGKGKLAGFFLTPRN